MALDERTRDTLIGLPHFNAISIYSKYYMHNGNIDRSVNIASHPKKDKLRKYK